MTSPVLRGRRRARSWRRTAALAHPTTVIT
ncbi:hypothetical protein J2W14_002175 [Pseudarthrobacter oxydans]|nr:hypothetical protein [Pseudarthrobacter oxydans]